MLTEKYTELPPNGVENENMSFGPHIFTSLPCPTNGIV